MFKGNFKEWSTLQPLINQAIPKFNINITPDKGNFFGNTLVTILDMLSLPFKNPPRQAEVPSWRLNVDQDSFKYKAVVGMLAVVIVLVIVLISILYGAVSGIPTGRVMTAIAGSITMWGILTTYLEYIFRHSFGRPTSLFVAGSISLFIAIIFGSWLMNLELIDRILGWVT